MRIFYTVSCVFCGYQSNTLELQDTLPDLTCPDCQAVLGWEPTENSTFLTSAKAITSQIKDRPVTGHFYALQLIHVAYLMGRRDQHRKQEINDNPVAPPPTQLSSHKTNDQPS